MERKSLEIIDEYWDELLTDQGKNIFLKDQLLWSSLTYSMDQTYLKVLGKYLKSQIQADHQKWLH